MKVLAKVFNDYYQHYINTDDSCRFHIADLRPKSKGFVAQRYQMLPFLIEVEGLSLVRDIGVARSRLDLLLKKKNLK